MGNHAGWDATEVAPGVHFVEGPASNWVILEGDGTVTLVDAGYPRDISRVEESIRAVADVRRLTTILITHGHSDHIGTVAELSRRYQPSIFAAPEEIPNVTREVVHQIGVGQLLPHLYKPRFLAWMMHALRAGGLDDVAVSVVQPLTIGTPMRLSGHDIVPWLTPGHTPGHTVYTLPGHDVLITGDAAITAHPTSTRTGVQSLDAMWHWSPDAAGKSVTDVLRLPGRILLPGHGPLEDRG